MGLINVILNLAALLIWLKWRLKGVVVSVAQPGRSLISTLKRTESVREPRWLMPGALVLLLGVRSAFYRNLGPAVDWVPSLHLGAIALHFRSDRIELMILFSLLSFALTLFVFYTCLLLLSVVNRSLPQDDPLQKLARHFLAWVDAGPAMVKLVLPFCAGALLWAALTTPLSRLGVLPAPDSAARLWKDAAVISLYGYLAWKPLIIGVLLLHMVNSYVYLGSQPLWLYASNTSRNLLFPLRFLPLRFGRVDFLPLAGLALVVGLAELAEIGLRHLHMFAP